MDRRGRRVDGGPAARSRRAHDSGDLVPRSRRAGLLWRESVASENAEPGRAGGNSRVDSKQFRARAAGHEDHTGGSSIGGGVKALTPIRYVTLISVGGPEL